MKHIKKYRYKSAHHPATKIFQALRIYVNDELAALKEGLEKSFEVLESQGNMVIVSFHSLEDRIVKHFFQKQQVKKLATIVTQKPVRPSFEERTVNPMSRSAKLRVLAKL